MKKVIEVDFDSMDDLSHWINILRSSYCGLKKSSDPNYMSKNDRVKVVFNSCQKILDSDVSHLYKDFKLDPRPIYYVYAHCDTGFKIAIKKNGKTTFAATLGMNYVPFYIGKGTGNRDFDLNRNESHKKVRQKLQKFGKDVDVKIIKEGLTELDALCLESKLIDIFGLISQRNGYLVNLDEGVKAGERHQLYKDHLHNISLMFKNSV